MCVSLILLVLLIAVEVSQYRNRRKYHLLEANKLISSQLEEGRLEKVFKYVEGMTLVIFVVIVAYSAIKGSFDEPLMLYLVAGYLFLYYALEYISHHKWCLTEEGLRSSRQIEVIGYERIVNFTWYESANKLILRVNYKGRGIVTRKSDYVVPPKKRQEVEKILKSKVIITRG